MRMKLSHVHICLVFCQKILRNIYPPDNKYTSKLFTSQEKGGAETWKKLLLSYAFNVAMFAGILRIKRDKDMK